MHKTLRPVQCAYAQRILGWWLICVVPGRPPENWTALGTSAADANLDSWHQLTFYLIVQRWDVIISVDNLC